VSYQSTRLQSDQSFPIIGSIDHTYEDVLPSMTLTGTFSGRRNLRLNWSTSSNPPNINQLQPVVDNSNPLSLSAGNPTLSETYSNNFTLRLTEADPMHSRSRFLFANVVRTSNPISNYTYTAPVDTVVSGIALVRGTQLTRPVNLDVSWVANVFAAYSRPAKWMKSIVTVNGGGSFNQSPTKLNSGINRNRTTSIRFGSTIASNISTNLDFTLSYQGNYNMSRNTLTANNTADYYSHNLGLRLSAQAPNGMVAREEVPEGRQGRAALHGDRRPAPGPQRGPQHHRDLRPGLARSRTRHVHAARVHVHVPLIERGTRPGAKAPGRSQYTPFTNPTSSQSAPVPPAVPLSSTISSSCKASSGSGTLRRTFRPARTGPERHTKRPSTLTRNSTWPPRPESSSPASPTNAALPAGIA